MKLKRIMAMVLCVAMVLSTMGTVAFAEETYVATVDGVEIPSATVTEIDKDDLTFAVKFKADSPTAEQRDKFWDWDINIELISNKEITFDANGSEDGYISVWLPELTFLFNGEWKKLSSGAFIGSKTIEANTPLKVIDYMWDEVGNYGMEFGYIDFPGFTEGFDCGAFFEEEFLAANPDLNVELALKIYNPSNPEESYTLGSYTFGETADAVATVSNYDELVAALANVEAEKTIELTDDITIDTKITVPDGVILDLKDNTLYVNVENSTYNNVTIKNGNIVLGKDDVHVCDGYLLVKEGKTLVLNDVNMSSAADGIKCYAVFHLKTGANLDLIDSELDIRDNEYEAGYIVYANESTASVDVIGTTVTGTNVNGIVHATTVIDNSEFTIADAVEHGINRSAVTIDDSTVTISRGTGRGITAQHGDLVISGDSVVNISNMGEATIELRNNKNLTVADTANVTVDVPVNNTTSGAIIGDVVVSAAAVATVNGVKYSTLADAIAAAQNGDTVEIYAGEYGPINISNKNITIKGTVGDDGELLTTIKGGDPAITAHSFNGTIKDIKIVDAWKVMYAEPAGNVTVDNVYVTGATYGFHLVAYSPDLTWTIQNSYMDLRWANSFGVAYDGYADIIIKGNRFESTNPYYPDYGAIHVNAFLPSVTVEENIFGENAKIYIDKSVTDTSKINISKNYHADGVENAFVDDADGVTVPIYQYYTGVDEDGKLTGLVEIPSTVYVATVNGVEYSTLTEAAGEAKAGDTIMMIANASFADPVTLPAGVTLNGNGYKIDGTVWADGDLIFEGNTKIAAFSASSNGGTITIGEGACLEITGTGRVTLGYGNVFNITGSIADAKTADKTNIQASLIIPGGISITGGSGAEMNVTNAYVKIGNTSSKNNAADGKFDLNFENSIAEFTHQFTLSEPTSGKNPTFEVNVKDSVLTTATKLCIAAPNTTMVIDNSTVNLGSYLRNSGELTLVNGSAFTGSMIQFGESGGNNGDIIVDGSTLTIKNNNTAYAMDGKGVGTLTLKNGAVATIDYIKDSFYSVDKTSTLNVKGLDGCEEQKETVAKIGETYFETLEDAFKAATANCTIEILADVTIDYYWDARYTGGKFTVPVTINGNDHTLKFTNTVYDAGNHYSVFRFEAPATVKNLTIDMTDAISGFGGRFRAISSKDDLTVDNCTFIGNGSANNTRAIIFGEGAGSAIGDVEVSITNSTFTGWRRGVSDNENAQDAKSVVITKNTFTDAEVAVSATDVITFTDNTVTGKYVKITSYTKAENLVVTATGNTLTANVDDSNMNFIEVASKNITAQEEFYIPSDAVAKIGDVEYATLQAAIDAAVSGDTITLLADAVGDVTVAADDNLVLDLNGFDIVGEMTGITNNGTLIINDSVGTGNVYTSDVSAQGRATIQNYGNITINGGWFGDSNNDMSDRNAINRGNAVKNYGKAVINGGYFTNVSNQYIGTDAYAYAINTLTSGTTTINNATVYGDINGLIYSDGTTIVKDGSYTLGRPNEENNLWYLAYGNVEIHGGTWTRAFKVPSWNTADLTFNGNVKASGGIFNVNIEAYVAQGYAAIKNLDGNYVVGTKPTATVNNEGMQTIVAGEYGIWDGSFYKGTEDMPLSFVMQFIADQTGEDMATSPYADWYADFVLTFDGLENDSFDTTGCYLAGYYGEFGWIKVPVEGILDSIEEGVRYPVMLGVGLGQKYDYVCSGVQDFKCALYLTPEILEANPNLTVNLELAVVDSSKGSDEAAAALVNNENTYKVVDYTYDRDDFVVANYVAQVGETKYATLDEAIAVGGDVVLLADVELANTITVNKDVSLDLNGYTISGACNASQAHMFMVNNGAQMTIKDSSDAETGKITYNGTNATGWIVDVEGKLVLESGTLELTGTWSIGYAVDVRPNAWGSAYTEATSFVMNGGKIVSSDGGVRVASSSSETYSDISASFKMNGGEIDAAWDGVFVQQSNAVWDVLSFIMNDGTIKSGLNPVRFYGPAATSYVNGEDCVDIVFNGGILAYTGTEERTWLVENILRLGGEVTEDEFLKDSTVTASASFAETNVAEGYKWVESDGVYTLEKVKLFKFVGTDATLGSSLALNLYWEKVGETTADGCYAVVEQEKETGTITTTITSDKWTKSGNYMVVGYDKIAAKEMADNVKMTIYYADGTPASETYVTSIREYAIGSLKQYGTNSAYAKWLPVYIDMLNYGAAAQEEFGYNLDDLANKGAEDFQVHASKEYSLSADGCSGTDAVAGRLLSLKSVLQLEVYFKNVTEGMYATYSYTTYAGTKRSGRVEYDSLIKLDNYYGVAVGISIANAASLVTVKLFDSNNNELGTAVYSANEYLKCQIESEEHKDDPIYPALAKVAASAKKAFLAK